MLRPPIVVTQYPGPARLRGGTLLTVFLYIVGVVVLLTGVYVGALRYFAPEKGSLTAWGAELDAALASAAQSGRPVLVKAGSEW